LEQICLAVHRGCERDVAARESQETTTRATTDAQNARPRTIVVVDVADDVVV